MTKKITKVIVYFDDGTFEEMRDQPSIKPMSPVPPPPVLLPWLTAPRWPTIPNDRQYWWTGPYVTWCTNNAPSVNKYSITTRSNGNVEIQK